MTWEASIGPPSAGFSSQVNLELIPNSRLYVLLIYSLNLHLNWTLTFWPPNTVFNGSSEVAGFLTAANFRSFVSGNVSRQKCSWDRYNSLSCTGRLACNSCSQTGLFSSDYLLLLRCSDVGGRLLLSRNFFHQVYHLFSLFISKAPLILLFSPHNSLL